MVSRETLPTVLMLVSRKTYIETLDCLEDQTIQNEYNFAIVIDTPEITETQIRKQLQWRFGKETKATIAKTNNLHRTNKIEEKRERVKTNYLLCQKLALQFESEYFWILEDDTLFPESSYSLLSRQYPEKGLAIASGLQPARHGTPAIGAWRYSKPGYIETIPYDPTIKKVDAIGLYCAFLNRKTLETIDFQLKPKHPADLNASISITKAGGEILPNWNILCGHRNDKQTITIKPLTPIVEYKTEGDTWTYARTKKSK